MTRAHAAVLLAGSLTLANCAGPVVRTAPVPAIQPQPAWRTSVTTSAAANDAWWQSLGDPVLTSVVNRALLRNTDLAIAAGRVRELRAAVDLARAQMRSSLDAGLGGARSRTVSAFGLPIEQTSAQPLVQAAYEIDLFGRLSDQKEAARSSYLAGVAGRDALRLTVSGAAATGYITLRGLDARLAIARVTLEARSEAVRVARSRVGSGYSPRLEFDQALAERDVTAQIVPSLQLAIARTENALSVLMGDTPGRIPRGLEIGRLRPTQVPVSVPSELLRRRPDIAQAELLLASSDSSLLAARKRFLPQVRLSAAVGATASTLLSDPISIWSVGGSILAPLFSGGRLRAQAEAAGGQRDQAAFAYRRAALNAFREVEDALAAVSSIDEQVVAARSQHEALRDGFARAQARYRGGYSPYLEQLDAQRGLLSAELNLAQLQADALTSRVQLYQAAGGDWVQVSTTSR